MYSPVLAMNQAVDLPVTIRLAGTLDRVLIESFCDACAGLAVCGKRTLFVLMHDLDVVGDAGVDRLFAALSAQRQAGHHLFVQTNATWRRFAAARGVPQHRPQSRSLAIRLCSASVFGENLRSPGARAETSVARLTNEDGVNSTFG